MERLQWQEAILHYRSSARTCQRRAALSKTLLRTPTLSKLPNYWRTTFSLRQACLALWLLLCAPILGVGCATRQSNTLVVYAASSLTEAFTAIGAEFEARHTGVQVVFNFAGSQALRLQIEHGAAADLFASADTVHTDRLRDLRLLAEEPVVFAENSLIVALPAANPAQLTSMRDLARPGVRIVMAQENVPAGRYTRRALANLSTETAYGSAYRDAVLANVRSEELNVRQVFAKVVLGEADAGFVYVSDVATATASVVTIGIPAYADVRAQYPIALLATAKEEALARRFIRFVQTPAAQGILRQAGLQAVE